MCGGWEALRGGWEALCGGREALCGGREVLCSGRGPRVVAEIARGIGRACRSARRQSLTRRPCAASSSGRGHKSAPRFTIETYASLPNAERRILTVVSLIVEVNFSTELPFVGPVRQKLFMALSSNLILSPGSTLRSAPRVVDLFAGAGLLSYAFARSGFVLDRAVEMNAKAAATYRLNLGDEIECADVRRVRPVGRCDVLVAGPPCQGFSTLGKRDRLDPRNRLSMYVVRWAEVLQPKIIVIENVAAFLDAPIWTTLRRRLQRAGYEVSAAAYNAVDFGVAQLRMRSFTFATRVAMPVPKPKSGPPQTVRDVWVGLTSEPDGLNHHYAPKPSELALERMRLIQPGGDKRDVLLRRPDLAPPSWRRPRNEITDVWGRMVWERPSNTLRTALQNPSKGRYIHPEQHRVISLREAARLHSIPDNWQFAGEPYPIAAQIGNSVPPLLGMAVARAVRKALG